MSSGIKVSDEVRDVFESVSKRQKTYAVFKFQSAEGDTKKNEYNLVSVDAVKVEPPANTSDAYTELIGTLPSDDVRYIAYDFDYDSNGVKTSKVILISWVPASASVKKRMLAASTFNTLKRTFKIESNYIEADDLSEISADIVNNKLKMKY